MEKLKFNQMVEVIKIIIFLYIKYIHICYNNGRNMYKSLFPEQCLTKLIRNTMGVDTKEDDTKGGGTKPYIQSRSN